RRPIAATNSRSSRDAAASWTLWVRIPTERGNEDSVESQRVLVDSLHSSFIHDGHTDRIDQSSRQHCYGRRSREEFSAICRIPVWRNLFIAGRLSQLQPFACDPECVPLTFRCLAMEFKVESLCEHGPQHLLEIGHGYSRRIFGLGIDLKTGVDRFSRRTPVWSPTNTPGRNVVRISNEQRQIDIPPDTPSFRSNIRKLSYWRPPHAIYSLAAKPGDFRVENDVLRHRQFRLDRSSLKAQTRWLGRVLWRRRRLLLQERKVRRRVTAPRDVFGQRNGLD